MEEKVRYTILDSVFSTDTVALMNIEGEILRDTLIFDTVINLVRDGRANFYDSLGFNLHKEYSTGKARKEVYWNYEIGYEMWSIGYDATKDTLFFNHILKDNKSELSKILSGKKWMASGESASNFFSQKENAVSKFEIGKEYGRVGLSFSQPDSENHITISVRRTEDTEDFNGKWKLEEGNHLTIELGKKRLDYLILFLDDEQMMLKLISDTE
ncbi:MAG TPA: hypothetical protein VE978_25945 [Chitinophagales bacterium]|nr:hypothetical protein [Chitinophagales bacterium]